MKYLAAVMAVLIMAGGAFAADSGKAASLKITKITGTVNLMKDGLVVMTLKPGDAIPQLVDPSMTFAVVDGSIEVEANGQVITGTSGSNFTVTSEKKEVTVVTAAGSPVEVKTVTGNSVVITQNSEVNIETSKKSMEVSVVSGSAVMTNATGGESKTINSGESAKVAVVAPMAEAKTEAPAPVEETPVVTETIPVLPTTPSVNPTQEVAESDEVSPSNP